MLAMLLASATNVAIAKDVYINPGEGGAGLDACMEMGRPNELNLCLRACGIKSRSFDLMLSLHPGEKAPSELSTLSTSKDQEQKAIYVCLGDICEERTWIFTESAFGDAFFTKMKWERNLQGVRSLRVVLSDDKNRYEYTGDLQKILNKICR